MAELKSRTQENRLEEEAVKVVQQHLQASPEYFVVLFFSNCLS
jgi:hypothetical protein